MEPEETKEFAAPPVASPIIEATPNFPEEIEGLSVPLPTSPIIEQISTSVEETTLSQPTQVSLEEPSQQTEKSDAQLVKAIPHQEFPDSVIKEALKALIDNTISVVEYGNQVLYRCGYAEVLIVRDETIHSTPPNRNIQLTLF